MNKIELSEKIAEKVGITKAEAEKALDAFMGITIDVLKQGEELALTGFGTFSARERKGREGINPRNPQQKITIPATVVAKFKAGKKLKDELKSSMGGETEVPTEKPEETAEAPAETPTEEAPAQATMPSVEPAETPTEEKTEESNEPAQ